MRRGFDSSKTPIDDLTLFHEPVHFKNVIVFARNFDIYLTYDANTHIKTRFEKLLSGFCFGSNDRRCIHSKCDEAHANWL